MTYRRTRCETCDVKIPKSQPNLVCSICKISKHLRCQRLTKADANYIKYLAIDWFCEQCMRDILPIDACPASPTVRQVNSNSNLPRIKVKCNSCSGY